MLFRRISSREVDLEKPHATHTSADDFRMCGCRSSEFKLLPQYFASLRCSAFVLVPWFIKEGVHSLVGRVQRGVR